MAAAHPSSSKLQVELERPVMERGCAAHGIDPTGLRSSEHVPVGNAEIIVDGWIGGDPPLALEVFVTLDKPKPGQQKKLRADILKLALLGHERTVRRAIVVTSDEAATWVSSGWTGEALNAFGIEVWRVALEPAELAPLEEVRARQRLGNVARG